MPPRVALRKKQFVAAMVERGVPTTERQVEHAILTGRLKPRRVAGWWSFGPREIELMTEYRRTVRAGRPPWKHTATAAKR